MRMWASICAVYDLSPGELATLWSAAQTADLIAATDEILWSPVAQAAAQQRWRQQREARNG
jgi:hypothetical protein